MYYQLFVSNLAERTLHVVVLEAERRGHIIKFSHFEANISRLYIRCDDRNFLSNIIDTLETQRNLEVIQLKTSSGEHLDIKAQPRAITFPWFNRYTLSMAESDTYGTFYAY